MEPTTDLQIHSNVSVPIIPDYEAEVEVEEDPYIRHGKYRAFIRKSAFALFFLHLFMLQALLAVKFGGKDFKSYFTNYKSIYNPYAITSLVILVVSVAAVAIVSPLARGLSSFFFVPVIYVTAAYLLNLLALSGTKFNLDVYKLQDLYYFYGVFLFGSLGLFINTLSIGKKFNPRLGVAISGISQLVWIVVIEATDLDQRHLWLEGVWVLAAFVYAAYINYDARLMINHRDDFYLQKDWFLAFIHFNTDFTFRFWRDLFKPQKKKAIMVVKSRADKADKVEGFAESRVVQSRAEPPRVEKRPTDLEAPHYLSTVRKPSVETSASQKF